MKKLNAKQLQTLPRDKYHDGNGLYISISKPGRGKCCYLIHTKMFGGSVIKIVVTSGNES